MASLSGTCSGAFKGSLVRVYNRDTGVYVGATISDASTGAWSITTAGTGKHIAYAMSVPGDPYADKLVFASTFDGTNGGTISTAITGQALTFNNSLTLSSAQAAQGATSLGAFSGTKALTFSASGLSWTTSQSCWMRAYVYPTSTPISRAPVFSPSTRTAYKGLTFGLNGRNAYIDVPNTGEFTGTGNYLNLNQWNRFDVSYISGMIYVFINGNLSLTQNHTSQSPLWESAGSIIIGNMNYGGTFNYPFPGYIDAADIHSGMNIGSTSFTPPPLIVGYPSAPTENCLIFDNLTPV